ncbi:MAG: beta-galactosidase [Mucilaginibacter sp.]|nr:beta-galactosidase [Mucilaginibacter sp.]
MQQKKRTKITDGLRKPIQLLFLVIMLFIPAAIIAQSRGSQLNQDTINLHGIWLFQVDPSDEGIANKWFNSKLKDQIKLPGSMTTNGKGDEITVHTPWTGGIEDSSWFHKPDYAAYRVPGKIKIPFWLQPDKYYKGVAWYQKTVNVPSSWKNRSVEFFIERAHWETTVYIDDKRAGMQNSLATPHLYTIEGLKPGIHRITVRIDNRVNAINVGENSHSISDHTQGNWNGMVGRLYLTAQPETYIDNVQLFPDIAHKQVIARVAIKSVIAGSTAAALQLQAFSEGKSNELLQPVSKTVRFNGKDTIELIYPMGRHPLLWSEFHPAVYHMRVTLSTRKTSNARNIIFGMRSFSEKGTQFTINGHPTFLRGTLDCAAFPLTGFPPTDVPSWMQIFKTCKAYGLNHIRFHSWCPPEAAFEAADRIGMYFQIECSSWANQGATIGDGTPLDQYIYDESKRISDTYGNHPSFCMLAYGNEPAGKHLTEYLTSFVKYWKARDNRRLYTTGSGWPVISESNYNSTPDPRIQHWGEGLKSVINGRPPSTDYDWSGIIAKWQHPTVSHEIGQWCVYPDFKEISKYTGIFKARNFEIFKDRLDKNGLAAYEESFLISSGKLQTLCYKADIEAALRTKGFGGFQLLGLEDFPGQGTALVGVLSAFYQPKAYVTAAQYNHFCNAVVPLARFPKMVFLNNETLDVPVEIAQFSGQPLIYVSPQWKITDASGKTLVSGHFNKKTIPEGNGIPLGSIKQALSAISTPEALKLTIQVGNYQNSWDFFVYPAEQPISAKDLIITDHLNPELIGKLNQGSKILLTLKKGSLKKEYGGNVAIGFSSIFWNTAWTNGQPPETLGIQCNPKHPSLKYFPTEGFSGWQWWDAMTNSSPVMLDSVKKGMKPLVRVIDDWVKARSLSLIFECKVGKGKLIVSGIDLLTDNNNRPEAMQLLYSLEKYMDSSDFSPADEVDINKISLLTQ